MTPQPALARPVEQRGRGGAPHAAGMSASRWRGLSPEEWRALEAAASPARPVEANVELIREGGPSDALLLMVEGWAYRYATTRQGGRLLPALLLPGDVTNLDTLMFERLDFGVRTASRCSVVTLPKERALALAAEHPGIARTFTRLALTENAVLSRWALSLGRRSAQERLAHLLCELSVRLDAEVDNRSSFAFPLTQEHLADVLGLTPVHVNRVLQRLRQDDLIRIANRTITVPDVAALRRAGEFDPRYLHLAEVANTLAA